jgi:hypothetical protein
MASDFDRLMERLGAMHVSLKEIQAAVTAGITVTVHHTHDAETSAKLDTIIQTETIMAGELDALKAAVANNNSLIDSAITLLRGLKTALDAAIAANAAGDPTALATLSASLGTEDAALAAAIAANAPPPAGGNPIALPAGTVGVPYSATLEPIVGLAPFTNSLSGAPAWLACDLSAPLVFSKPAVPAGPDDNGDRAALIEQARFSVALWQGQTWTKKQRH